MVADDAKKGIIPIRLVHQAKRSDRRRSSGGSKVIRERQKPSVQTRWVAQKFKWEERGSYRGSRRRQACNAARTAVSPVRHETGTKVVAARDRDRNRSTWDGNGDIVEVFLQVSMRESLLVSCTAKTCCSDDRDHLLMRSQSLSSKLLLHKRADDGGRDQLTQVKFSC